VLSAGAFAATLNGNLTVKNTAEVLTTDLNQNGTTAILAFADIRSVATGSWTVTGTSISGGTTLSSFTTATTSVTQTANGSFVSGQKVIPMVSTGSYSTGMQCRDTTQTNVIPDGDVIDSISANTSITLHTNVANNSAGTADTVKCDPVVTLSGVTSAQISSGASITFTQSGTGLVIAPNLPTSCSGQATGTLWNNSGAVGVC
jgi:hypothetical protein